MHRTGTQVTHRGADRRILTRHRPPGTNARVSTRTGLSADELVARLTAGPGREDRLTHLQRVPGRAGTRADWPAWVAPALREALVERGVPRPWSHQVAAAEAARRGEHVVLATGTASGKSLGYLLPALTDVLDARDRRGQRGATVLYLAPTKALAQDQLAAVRGLDLPDLRATTHDGDSPREQRDWARDFGEYVLTNPDMLHRSLLPGHARWARFFSLLRYVVIDECHHYRGVFGAHVAQIVRRLRRVCASYGVSPTFVLASATVAEPDVAAGRLTGLPVTAVTEDGSQRGSLALALWEPPFSSHEGENGAPVRRSTTAEVADLLTDLVLERVRTLAFIRSRRGAETVALTARRLLGEVDPTLAERVAAYRGGYLPEDRRVLERALRDGDLLGVAATNALELGIDVAGLDAVLMAGFPGTRAALWQQIGRAGRGGQDALGVFVARDDPLDTYLVTHPESLLGAPVEANVFDPENPYVLGPHLCAAAAEVPLTEEDLVLFGPGARAGVEALTEAGLLRRRPRGWFWTDRRRACDLADIRSTGGSPVRLVEQDTGRLLGTVDAGSAHGTVHAGAVYLHQGETYLVCDLDLEESWPWSRGGPRLLHLSAGNHRHQHRGRAPPRLLGPGPGELRRRARQPPGRLVPPPACALGRGARRGAPRPSGADPGDQGRVVDAARRPARGRRPRRARPARRGPRRGARLHRPAPPVRDLRPLGHRRRVHRAAPRHRSAHGVRLRRPPRRRGLRRARVRGRGAVAVGHPGSHRGVPLRGRLPVVRAVAQVRQRQQPPRQGSGPCACSTCCSASGRGAPPPASLHVSARKGSGRETHAGARPGPGRDCRGGHRDLRLRRSQRPGPTDPGERHLGQGQHDGDVPVRRGCHGAARRRTLRGQRDARRAHRRRRKAKQVDRPAARPAGGAEPRTRSSRTRVPGAPARLPGRGRAGAGPRRAARRGDRVAAWSPEPRRPRPAAASARQATSGGTVRLGDDARTAAAPPRPARQRRRPAPQGPRPTPVRAGRSPHRRAPPSRRPRSAAGRRRRRAGAPRCPAPRPAGLTCRLLRRLPPRRRRCTGGRNGSRPPRPGCTDAVTSTRSSPPALRTRSRHPRGPRAGPSRTAAAGLVPRASGPRHLARSVDGPHLRGRASASSQASASGERDQHRKHHRPSRRRPRPLSRAGEAAPTGCPPPPRPSGSAHPQPPRPSTWSTIWNSVLSSVLPPVAHEELDQDRPRSRSRRR